MSRSFARECAFKLVYEYLFTKEKDDTLFEEMISDEKNKNEMGYISEVYNGVMQNYQSLIDEIKKYSEDFKVERIYKIDLAILLVSVYEIKNGVVPPKVSVNEALNIAKQYSTEKSSKFINGILSNFVGA